VSRRRCRKRKLGLAVVAIAGALVSTTSATHAYTSLKELVYAFTYGSEQDVSARDQQMNIDIGGQGMTSGISHYHGSLTDKGTIKVDILSQQPDQGLVVSISEQGENTRRAPPATCVVYGDTRVICDPSKTVYPEEYTLLRFLGPNFIDPSQFDANKHWSVSQHGSVVAVKADYTVTGSDNGTMEISESRKIVPNAGGSLTTDIQTKLGYNVANSVPTSIDEYVTQRQDNGVSGTTTTIYQTTLHLLTHPAAPS
jgi:hypothetical protein